MFVLDRSVCISAGTRGLSQTRLVCSRRVFVSHETGMCLFQLPVNVNVSHRGGGVGGGGGGL